jgi:hypothetical protein
LADAEFAIDAHPGVDFFTGVAVGFETDFGFEELDLGGVLRRGRRWGLCGGVLRGFLRSLLRLRDGENNEGEKTRNCECAQEWVEAGRKSQDGLAGSVGRGRRRGKEGRRQEFRQCDGCSARKRNGCLGRRQPVDESEAGLHVWRTEKWELGSCTPRKPFCGGYV